MLIVLECLKPHSGNDIMIYDSVFVLFVIFVRKPLLTDKYEKKKSQKFDSYWKARPRDRYI